MCSAQGNRIHQLELDLTNLQQVIMDAKAPSQVHLEEVARLKCQLEAEQNKNKILDQRSKDIEGRYKQGELVSRQQS